MFKMKHDDMVKVVVDYLKAHGFTSIKAEIEGYSCPEEIEWKVSKIKHRPAVSCFKGATNYIFEIETEDSISNDHTQSQCKLFAAYAAEHQCKFILAVPEGVMQAAKDQLAKWNVRADVVEV